MKKNIFIWFQLGFMIMTLVSCRSQASSNLTAVSTASIQLSLNGTPQATSVSLSWSSTNTSITSFEVGYSLGFTSISNWKNIGKIKNTLVTGLQPGTTYSFRVRASTTDGSVLNSNTLYVRTSGSATSSSSSSSVNSSSSSIQSSSQSSSSSSASSKSASSSSLSSSSSTASSSAASIADPSGLAAIPISASQINLQWNDNSNNETGFKLEQASAMPGPYVLISNLSANTTSYQATGLSPNTAYYFRVTAYNASTSSHPVYGSAVTLADLPSAPSNLSASVISPTQINLSWTDNSSKETGYVLERSADNRATWSTLVNLAANATAYSDLSCQAGKTYIYRVKASGGGSNYSNEVSATTASQPPASPMLELSGFLSDVGTVNGIAGASVDGSKLYLASDPFGLVSVDIRNPAAPVVSASQTPFGKAWKIAISDHIAVAGTPDGASIIDLNDPELKVMAVVPGNAPDVAIKDGFAYLAGVNGVRVVDIRNPASPVVTSPLTQAGTVMSIAVSGNRAVICGSLGVQVLDLSNPGAPRITGTFSIPAGGYAIKVASNGNLAIVTDIGASLLRIIDISNPSSPRQLSTYSSAPLLVPQSIWIEGDRAYVGYGGYLTILDIRNPSSPQRLGAYQPISSGGRVNLNGGIFINGLAYISDGSDTAPGLWVADLSDPAHPVTIGHIVQSPQTWRVALSGNVAFAAGVAGLNSIDLGSFAKVGSVPGNAPDVAIKDGYAYLTGLNGVRVVDIRNPADPVVITTLATAGTAMRIAISGNLAIITEQSSGIQLMDVTNPGSPRILGSLSLGGLALDVAIAGNIAAIGNLGLSSLQLVDISNPSSPRLLSTLSTGVPYTLSIYENSVYVGVPTGLMIVDIRNPSVPRKIGLYNPGASFSTSGSVFVNGIAYICGGSTGLWVANLSDPAHPVTLGHYPTPGSCNGVATDNTRIVTADSLSGIVVFTMK